MSEPEFKASKDDVLTVLKHLRHVAPKHATPEKAIRLLEWQHTHYKALEELHPDVIEEVLKDFESN